MFTAYDKLNNTFSMSTTSFTARGASFGISVKPANHTNPRYLGEWGNGATFLTTAKGAGNSMASNCMIQLIPVHHGRVIPYAIETSPYEMKFRTEYGDIRCCFADPSLLLLKGENGLGLKLEKECVTHGVIRNRGTKGFELTEALISCFVFNPLIGEIEMNANWELERMSTPLVRNEVKPAEDGTFLLSIEETEDLGYIREAYPTYEEALAAVKADFEEFYGKLLTGGSIRGASGAGKGGASGDDCGSCTTDGAQGNCCAGGEKTTDELAAYILWSMIEAPSGRLKRSIIHSNYTHAAATWTTCLITAALKNNLPQALELLLSQLDQQEANGEIPASFDHTNRDAMNAGLPLQGWALKKLMAEHDFKTAVSEETLKTLYEGYSKWMGWIMKYRDDDEDGIPQTEGTVEAGTDDSPVFKKYYVAELPEVCAYLALLSEALGDLAALLGLGSESAAWQKKAGSFVEKTLTFWDGTRFIGRDHYTGTVIDTESLEFYRPLVLGSRLPAEVIDAMAEDLTLGNGFLTKDGLLSQRMTSPDYSRLTINGGSIVAAENLMIIDGLKEAGRAELAKEAASLFVKGVGRGISTAETAAAYFLLKVVIGDGSH